MTDQKISNANSKYWDECCGTGAAHDLGIKDASKKSLKIFDEWYFNYYPYLDEHIQFDNLKARLNQK